MQDFFQNIRQFLGRLSRGQQIALGVVLIGGIAIILSIAIWSNQTEHALLFGDLSPSDANQVVEALREEGTAYELRQNGTAIYVPRDRVYELRMRFASEGVISDGPVGYELFDQGNMGMTDFMQKMNRKRALEGELARTISNMQQVEMARVHLVLPERNPFRENQVEASASVVVQHAGSIKLKTAQVDGITALVAGAVEGMDPAAVTVLDDQGNMLSDPNAGDPNAQLTSTQLEIQQEVEQHLMESGQSMLDQVLGPGHSIVRVSAALDFSRTVSQRDLIDPESQTVISEEQLNEESPEDNANSTVRNYEVSRTQERIESSTGDVETMTVSVILNQKPPPDNGEGAAGEPVSYTDEELQEIEAIVKNAVGFDEERGDRFAIHQTRFSPDANDMMVQQLQEEQQMQMVERYLRYGLIVMALLLGVWLIRSIAKQGGDLDENGLMITGDDDENERLEAERRMGEDDDVEDLVLMEDDVYMSKLSPEAQQALKRKHRLYKEVQNQITNRPDEAAELIRTWLIEDAIEVERERAKKQKARA